MRLHYAKYMHILWGFICLLCLLAPPRLSAQQPVVVDSSILDRITELEKHPFLTNSGEDHVMLVGLTTFGFISNKTTVTYGGTSSVTKTNSLVDGKTYEFSPMLLWNHGKKFLLEFEPSFADDQLGVNWADITFFAAPGLMFRGGYLVLPFGMYSKRLAAGWINKLATDPDGVAGFSDYGIEMQGGFHAGNMKLNYDFALANSPGLQPDGTLNSVGLSPTNNHKSLVGRIGWLPFSNSSVELGVSGLTGKVGNPGSRFESVKANMYAIDLNGLGNIKPFQFNLKGQYSVSDLSNATFINPLDSSNYTFNNHMVSGYLSLSIRPSFAENKVLKNFELAARYSYYETPANSLIGTKDHSFAVGLDYWLSWRTVIKWTYEAIKANSTISSALGGNPGSISQSNSMYLQFAIQL
jgi:hypothetical protein